MHSRRTLTNVVAYAAAAQRADPRRQEPQWTGLQDVLCKV